MRNNIGFGSVYNFHSYDVELLGPEQLLGSLLCSKKKVRGICYRHMLKMPVPQAKRAKWMQKLNENADVPFKFPSPTTEYIMCTFCEKMFLVTQ